MFKGLAACIVLLGIAFFLLRDDIEKLKQTVDAANALANRVEQLNKELDKFKLRFDEVEADNKRFQESAARYIQNSTNMLMELKSGK